MLIDARWQQHLIATLQLEPLFKAQHLAGAAGSGRRRANGHPAMQRSSELNATDNSHGLVALLRGLGVGPDVVKASIKRHESTAARAAALIADWMSYLPEDCVKAMVGDGWHWST
jgi:hypothetical protein